MKKKAFTLIELIAVLVILAILALIVTPLVMSIIRKARISADKRSVDAYGRSIELAIASYLLDNGRFPTSVDQLTIEYSGNQVVCSQTQLNSDSSVYLAGCTVAGRSTGDYEYGKYEAPTYISYTAGTPINYNGVDYYVLNDSAKNESTVTLVKATPLTTNEVNTYGGVGTENNVVNKYYVNDDDYPNPLGTAEDYNGYGGMTYYESEECYYAGHGQPVKTNCISDYSQSNVKIVVDAWVQANVDSSALKESRLVTVDEYNNHAEVVEYQGDCHCGGCPCPRKKLTDETLWMEMSISWLMSDNNSIFWVTNSSSESCSHYSQVAYVRPVIELYKSAL